MMRAPKSPNEKNPPLLAVPGRFFFVGTTPYPASVTADKIPALARLAVEAHSPFPEEKLAIGAKPLGEKLLVFAALRERIAAFVPAQNPPAHVVPDFALPLPQSDAPYAWVLTAQALTAIPRVHDTVVAVRGFDAPPTPDDALAHRARVAAAAGLPSDGPLWLLIGVASSKRPAGLALSWRDLVSDAEASTAISAGDLATADVRPSAALAALRREAGRARLLTLAVRALAVAACLLLCAQAGLWIAQAVAARREAALDANRPKAETAEANAAMLETWSRVTDRRPPLLERLAALNESRPDALRLRRVALDESTLTASGQARSMEALNGWLAALKQSKEFTTVAAPRIGAGAQGVSFELRAAPAKTTGNAAR